MILAPRPPFRAFGRPSGPGIKGSSRRIAQRFPAFSAQFPGQQFKGFRRKPILRAGFQCPCWFPMSPPVLESQRGSSVRVSGLAARLANQPRASLRRDWHQGQFAAICCTSLHSGTQHKSLSQKSKTITTFGLWVPLKAELCCLPATFRKWTLS